MPIARDLGSLGQVPRVREPLEVKKQQLEIRIFDNDCCQFTGCDIGVIAGGMGVTHPKPSAAQQAVGDDAHRATLTNDANRPVLRGRIEKHRRKVGNGTVAKICQALRIGPHKTHPN